MPQLVEISRSSDQADMAYDITALHTNAEIEHQRQSRTHDTIILLDDGGTFTFKGTYRERLVYLETELDLIPEIDMWAAAHWSTRTGRWQVCGTSLKLRKLLAQMPHPRD